MELGQSTVFLVRFKKENLYSFDTLINNKMSNIITTKDLGNGLELRVEPSFTYKHIDKTNEQGRLVMTRQQEPDGIDISFYKDGKLCLSPHADYYSLQNHETQVDRTLKRENVIPVFTYLIKKVVKTMPEKWMRVYEIVDADINPRNVDFDRWRENMDRISRCHDNYLRDFLFIESNLPSEPELIDSFWAREYPQNRGSDKYLGHVFSVYFIHPQKIGYNSPWSEPFEKAMLERFKISSDNSQLIIQSKSVIMSLSYGCRARFLGFTENELNGLVGESLDLKVS